MSDWAAPAGARARRSDDPTRASGRAAVGLSTLCLCGLGLCSVTVAACGTDVLKPRKAPISIVVGQPTVNPSGGTVERQGPVNAGDFGETNPVQIDTFTQEASAKVDVLWMIDNSGSMAPKQAKIEADFQDFITALTTPGANQAVVDYHIGVITTRIPASCRARGSGTPTPASPRATRSLSSRSLPTWERKAPGPRTRKGCWPRSWR